MTRFDYVHFDNRSDNSSQGSKALCKALESFIEENLENSREKSSAITKLEECFMWIGKAIKVDQLKREKDV